MTIDNKLKKKLEKANRCCAECGNKYGEGDGGRHTWCGGIPCDVCGRDDVATVNVRVYRYFKKTLGFRKALGFSN